MISRGILEGGRRGLRDRIDHTVDGVRGWLEVSRRPDGVTFREWLPFFRARLVCLVRGHADPRMLHGQEARGQMTRLEIKDVCGRCGELFTTKARVAQFPRMRS